MHSKSRSSSDGVVNFGAFGAGILVLLGGFSASDIAVAATLTGSLPVSASVTASCQNLVAGSLAHGSYDPSATDDNDAQTSVTVQCTNTTPLQLSASRGTGSLLQRQMASGDNRLNYNLYTNGARTTIWGDGSGGTATIAAIGAGVSSNVAVTIFSRIPKGQANAVPGAYSDSITVTVTY